MEYPEVLPLLTSLFEPSDYQKRDLPGGGGSWYFLNWRTIRDRLNRVCPGLWSSEVLDFQNVGGSKEWVCCRLKLTICGVHHIGVGWERAYPDVNDAGKEKIFGDQISNAVADAFKFAAAMHGIGVLDDQKAIARWVKAGNNNGKAAINQQIFELRQRVGASKEQVLEMMQNLFGVADKAPGDLTDTQVGRLIQELNSFQHGQHRFTPLGSPSTSQPPPVAVVPTR